MRISDWSSDVCSSDLVVSFHIPFLLRRGGGVAFLLKGKEKRGVAQLSPGTVDQQILRYAAKEAAGIGEAVALIAARRARENFLHEIRRFFRHRLSTGRGSCREKGCQTV